MSSVTEFPSTETAGAGVDTPNRKGWHGVDLDGTLAYYDGWKGPEHIGEAVPTMLSRVLRLIENGWTVKIFTARAADLSNHAVIHAWLIANGLPVLEVTDRKDVDMVQLWDDRAVAVQNNTGITHFDTFRFQRDGLETLARGLGIDAKPGRNYAQTLDTIFAMLGELQSEASGALDGLSRLRGDQFKGGDSSQAFRDVCAARTPLRRFVKRLDPFIASVNPKEPV